MPSASEIISVRLTDAQYDVTIQPGLLSEVGAALAVLSRPGRVGLVSDSAVGPRYAATVVDSLRRAGFEPIVATLPAGETHKTLADLLPVYDAFLAARVERSTPVLALGGGVVGDMTGFVAATLLRGVPFVQIPTTLLSMVDASVGGKTGVNAPAGKNLIGAFHQPIAVLIDPQVLTTLPAHELRSGLAECIKHEVIRDADGFAYLEKTIDRAIAVDVTYLANLVAHNVAIKARVVEADPFERGERAHLNFGHTFGHAIEKLANYSRPHGECVALGMVAASRLAGHLGLLDASSSKRIVELISRAGLPTKDAGLDAHAVSNAMGFDKKVKAGRVRLVLPDRIGHVIIRDDVDGAAILEAIQSLAG